MSGLLDTIFSKYPALGATFLSLSIFLNGHQYFRRGKEDTAAVWWVVALLALVVCGAGIFYSRQWLNGVAVVAVFVAEVLFVVFWEFKDRG